jgi:hypothetical protein
MSLVSRVTGGVGGCRGTLWRTVDRMGYKMGRIKGNNPRKQEGKRKQDSI